jgi:hypothetical protein
MSQRHVEQVIGRLATDEGLRHRFTDAPLAILRELADAGVELNDCEVEALAALCPASLRDFAERLDPRIQRVDLRKGPCEPAGRG